MNPVRATLAGSWPGVDPSLAAAVQLQELGAPQLPVIPELPARGPGSDPVGRTAIMLESLGVDLKPHGWRLTDTPGVDARRGAAAWREDLNRMADAAGESGSDLEHLTVRVVGPLTLVARLWLPGGERALSDSGARRDVADALASGLAEQVRQIRSVTGARQVTVVLAEPDAGLVLSGQVPTASGYRTVRSVPRVEARRAWSVVAEALADAGAGVVFAPSPGERSDDTGVSWTDLALLAGESFPADKLPASPETTEAAPFAGLTSPIRGLVVPVPRLEGPSADPARWELIAGWAEADRTVMLGLDRPSSGTAARAAVEATLRTLVRDWERMGLGAPLLGQLVIRGGESSQVSPDRALEITRAVVWAAETLERHRVDGAFGELGEVR